MGSIALRSVLILCASWLAIAQTANKLLTFDVASVKPAPPLTPDAQGRTILPHPTGGPGTQDPGRIYYPYTTLRNLLVTAYDVKSFQVSGPSLLDSERFDITATLPPDATKNQLRLMLQNLLAQRFKLALHRETKELPIYSMVGVKAGPKMKESTDPDPPADEQPLPPPLSSAKMGPDGFPVIAVPPGAPILILMMNGRSRMMARQKTMAELADRLTGLTSRPVIDATGLRGRYDFTLTYSPEGTNSPMPPPPPQGASIGAAATGAESEPLPDIFGALQAPLGLKLEAKKGPVEMLMIDHVEKTPTEN